MPLPLKVSTMTSEIIAVHAREVFDSRGHPTVEAVVTCRGARPGRAIAPAGASTGRAEARELRDGGERLGGWGVQKAVENVLQIIGPALVGSDAADQAAVDQRLIDRDGTPNKERLGANAILAVSLATAYAAAEAQGRSIVDHLGELWGAIRGPASGDVPIGQGPSLPLPMVNMISGGLHAGGQLELQDFLIVPVGAATYSQALEWIVTVYQQLGRLLQQHGMEGVLVGDEGGYGPKLSANQRAIELILEAITNSKRQPGRDIVLALDVAATHFYRSGRYALSEAGSHDRSMEEMIDLLSGWVRQYPILSLEDPLAEDDWDGWQLITQELGDRVQLIGDDLFATNPERLERGVRTNTANAVLIKLNQIGTLTETLRTMRLAIEHGYRPIISARSGETEDVTIADLAVATGAGQIKIGSVARSERLAKYNQLLRWEDESQGRWTFAGRTPLAKWMR
jgi:enolase